MTPQENELVNTLFDRLAKVENAPRDAAAERLIADGLQRAPHAVYALVQTALVQDEALKRANTRIEELEAQADAAQPPEQQPASFLDTMRQAVTGRGGARGSVPNVQPAPAAPGNPPRQDSQPQPGYPPQTPPGYPGAPPAGAGGSFLGNAASTAAGVLGGGLLLNGIRSMLGGRGASPFGALAGASPKEDGATDKDLARDLGADQVGDRADDVGSDQSGDADADADDVYDADYQDDGDEADDQDDGDDGDFDPGDGDQGDDSYDV
jgi:uncharacterized protein